MTLTWSVSLGWLEPPTWKESIHLGLDGCEVRPCDPCARVRPCVPCESRPPVLFTFSVYSYFGGSVHTPATFGVESVGDESRS
jgi:hypothetical protein